MTLRSRNQCKKIAQELMHKNSMFVLGKGYAEPIAFEGALKIKEMCYIHAEGYSGGALKHGPFALIEGATCYFNFSQLFHAIKIRKRWKKWIDSSHNYNIR
jgi:glucosamine 6-phosphate synthetase-like amidotransferase/phosphosugar isomerase protein